jgi:16S rRNA (cytosine1402-N4)-methyltransferase
VAEHIPVLVEQVVAAFSRLGQRALVVDGTCGLGGHSRALLESIPQSRVLGLDRDRNAVAHAAEHLERFGTRAVVRHSRFSRWPDALAALGLERASGLLLDLGVSSPQLDQPERGFSFRDDGPIDMRMDRQEGQTAREFLEDAQADEIARVIKRYGEERFAGRIARAIKRALEEGRLSTTSDLALVCRRAYPPPPKGARHRIDPATRTFQALRIHVNGELDELEQALSHVPAHIDVPGVVAVISFHSLEDRVVKQTFREWQATLPGRILKPAPMIADDSERQSNPRSRSAKLRVFLREDPEEKPPDKELRRSKRHRQP